MVDVENVMLKMVEVEGAMFKNIKCCQNPMTVQN